MHTNYKYKRIIILGGGGSGKSTLANRISLYTGYPVYHLDHMLLDSNWQMKDKKEWAEISKEFLSKDTGIVDGNYKSAIPDRIKWADLIIFIDIPTRVQLLRILKRFIRNSFKLDQRYGYPEGSKEEISFKFLLWVCTWNKNQKNKISSLLSEDYAKNKKVIVINEPRQLNLKELLS